jgi:hypothetical protein
MARNPQLTDSQYATAVQFIENVGYDMTLLQRVPQRW